MDSPRSLRAADLFAAVSPYLPAGVEAPPAAFELTGALARRIGFELPLATATRTELGAYVEPGERVEVPLPGGLARLAELLRDGATETARSARWFWLAWDPDRDGVAGGGMTPRRALRPAGAREVLELVAGASRPALEPALAEVAATPGAMIGSVGAMPSRPGAPMRVTILGLDSTGAADLTGRLGWAGDPARLAETWRRLESSGAELTLAVDLTDRLASRIGLEAVCRPLDRARWASLLGDLVTDGLATARRAKEVERFLGASGAEGAGEHWPDQLRAMEAMLGGGRRARVVRYLTHVKVSLRDGGPTDAKAYPGLALGWFA